MTQTPTDNQPGFVAQKPERCFACYRLIRPGQTYYLTIEHEILCVDCALDEEVIRVREDLAVELARFAVWAGTGSRATGVALARRAVWIESLPARSAIVRASLRMR